MDRHRTPGRFLLTGSANVLLLPKLSESLAGRMEILTLWPFSEGELRGVREHFVDRLFETDDIAASQPTKCLARNSCTALSPAATPRSPCIWRRAAGRHGSALTSRRSSSATCGRWLISLD